jgi:hypothetical protein
MFKKIPRSFYMYRSQRWAPVLFSRFSALERETKKNAGARRKKSMKKAKSLSTKEKSANSRFLLPMLHHIGNPVPESNFRGKSKGLE